MSAVAVGAAVVGAAGSIYAASQVKAPGQANYTPVDLQQQQNLALQGNLRNLPQAEQLSAETNSFNQSQALSLMNQAMPGYSSLAKNLTGLATNLSANPYALPADVQASLQRQAAEKGISTGRQGQAGQFTGLQDLGLNEIQYGAQNINQAESLTSLLAGIAPKVSPMSPMSMYVTPAQAAQVAAGNNENQQAIAQGGLNAQAAASNNQTTQDWSAISNLIGKVTPIAQNYVQSKNGPAASTGNSTATAGNYAGTGGDN